MRAWVGCRAGVAAAIICATGAAGEEGPAQSRPEFVSSGTIDLTASPLYLAPPNGARVVDGQKPEPVLVPLPPGAWTALSGLVGLAAVAAWRKHRFRQE